MPFLNQDVVDKKSRIGFAEWLGLPTLRPGAPWHSCLFETGAVRRVSSSPGPHEFDGAGKVDTKDVLTEASRRNPPVIHTCARFTSHVVRTGVCGHVDARLQ